MIWRKRLSTTAREILRECARANQEYPTCPHCQLSVRGTDRWHSGQELCPLLGGRLAADQIEHARCNLRFAAEYEVPLIAHNNRVRSKFIGAYQSRFPMPDGSDDPLRRKRSGE